MQKVRLYWEFHKSTLFLNWVVSLISILLTKSFLFVPITMMTVGPFLSLFYKEISSKNEYYFYYNRGISKINLIVVNLILNILTGLILLYIFFKCQVF